MHRPAEKILSVLTCVLLLAGCGGGGGSATDEDPSASPGPAPAAAVVGLLPFLTGSGELRLHDPEAAISGGNPVTVDTGLAPPPVGVGCNDCFAQARAFYTGNVSGGKVSSLRAARLAYVKRATANETGGSVFMLNLDKGAASNLPVRISVLADACRIAAAETTDFLDIDNSAVVVERAGNDTSCSAVADNVVTVIRLNSPQESPGMDIPLALDTGNPLHAQTNATGAITAYLSFETDGLVPRLVRRDAGLGNPETLLVMEQTTGANLERSDLSHLFVTASPDDLGLQLLRVEANGSLTGPLYSFVEFNAGNPILGGLHDASQLFIADGNKLLRVPLTSTTENAELMTTLAAGLRIDYRMLDAGTTPARLVFEAKDDGLTMASGVFSIATTASAAAATTLANYPDPDGGTATLALATGGRAYINIADHGINEFPNDEDDALRINTDGSNPSLILSAYWAGNNRATSFDLAQVTTLPVQFIFLAERTTGEGGGNDSLSVVDPATGEIGAGLGTVVNAAAFAAVHAAGLGRYALARVTIDRFGVLDNDVYFLDAQTAGSLAPLAETEGANDIPLGVAGD